MNHIKTKTNKRWWWWVALVCAIVVVVMIPLSYRRTITWFDPTKTVGLRLVNFSIVTGFAYASTDFNRAINPLPLNPVKGPWYGTIEVRGISDYFSAKFLPRLFTTSREFSIQIPLHLLLAIPLLIITYPLLPFVKKRHRRKHGLCVKCAYDLTGNTTGICPECGTKIEVDV